jgi:hypothetical protein
MLTRSVLFMPRVYKSDIGAHFPSYKGGREYAAGLRLMREEYFARMPEEKKIDFESESRRIYCHVTHIDDASYMWRATKLILLNLHHDVAGSDRRGDRTQMHVHACAHPRCASRSFEM